MQSDAGRKVGLLGSGLDRLAKKKGCNLTGTSVFDPVLCEVVYNWYSPKGGTVYDPFAGGSVRGIVAECLGLRYIGIDLSEKQVEANKRNAAAFNVFPTWYCDDSKNADKYISDESADIVFSCPPYHDLEKYSDNPLDLSNMSYTAFLAAYEEIIRLACKKLKNNRFAVFVVGDIRDRKGFYRDFVGDTKRIFHKHGLFLYNDCVLLEQYGTAPMRAGRQFSALRKVCKTHQNVLVFYKGDIENIRYTYADSFEWADISKVA